MQIVRSVALLAAMILMTAGAVQAQTAAKPRAKSRPKRVLYATYNNARFAYAIGYPSALLRPEPESDNGDGRKFTSNDGSALLTVWGENAVANQSLAALYKSQNSQATVGRVVTSKTLKPKWFVISWTENGRIYYRKTIARKGGFASFILEYDQARRDIFDPMVKAIADSFK